MQLWRVRCKDKRRYSASSLTDSLRSVVRLRRAVPAYWRGGNFLASSRKKLNRGSKKATAKPFFHRLRPLTSITKSDAQISGGETRQDLKIPGVSPGGSLVRSPVPAFRFTGVIPLLWPRLSHSTPDTQFRVGSSLQAGLYARTPFSPTAAPVPVTIDLSPTRKDTTKRHWQQPLVTWFADDLLAKHEVALEVCASVRLHWKDRFGCCALRKPVTTVQKLAG